MKQEDVVTAKHSKGVLARRKAYSVLVTVMLVVITVVVSAVAWYALYCYIIPSLNSFLFGTAGGANAVKEIDESVAPYTVAALWFIPSFLASATLNVLCWRLTVFWIHLMKRVKHFAVNKFDKANFARAEKGESK